ncbi:hypothetical protein D7Y11_25610 [Corallococcus sp. AB018]|uniref:hypothetical protein n=1 Tax=Corallococcus sp. AB018 TaxID=2316715 RepID=UPI000F893C4D|nr:hypothetical protein [Corallococcus sp. AB018]RUO90340.1 hypothetical protein D7Y11_25610 [Corallococcus sp. AB018]
MPAAPLLLSAATSLFATTWLLAAAPFSVAVEPSGFTVQSDGKAVTITQVVPGRPADQAKLTPGMRILRIESPERMFARGPIEQLGQTDLHDALIATWDEPLLLFVGNTREDGRYIGLKRDEPRPDEEFPGFPLPPEKRARLSLLQQQRHEARRLRELHRTPREKPGLELRHQSEAWVKGGQLRSVDGGGFTGLWIHPELTLDARCPDRLEKVVLNGPGKGLPRTFQPATDSASTGQDFTFDLPLWSVRDLTRACASGKSSLAVTLRAELSCKGEPALQQSLPVKLSLKCEQTLPDEDSGGLRLIGLRGAPEEYVTGTKAALTVEASGLDSVVPPVASVTFVEVDARGKVKKRFATVPVPAGAAEVTTELTLDTSTARTVRLSVEARFGDGSTRGSDTREVTIVTPAFVEARRMGYEEGSRRWQALDQRFTQEIPTPCADIAATVAWLRAQPEVESAHGTGHHNYDYRVKGSGITNLVNCHNP